MPHFTCETLPINSSVHAARSGKVKKCRVGAAGKRRKKERRENNNNKKTTANYILSFEGELIIT